ESQNLRLRRAGTRSPFQSSSAVGSGTLGWPRRAARAAIGRSWRCSVRLALNKCNAEVCDLTPQAHTISVAMASESKRRDRQVVRILGILGALLEGTGASVHDLARRFGTT